MEIHAYHYVVENEGRFGEHLRGRLGLEEKFVIQHPVIADFSLLITDSLRAGAVGYNLKYYGVG